MHGPQLQMQCYVVHDTKVNPYGAGAFPQELNDEHARRRGSIGGVVVPETGSVPYRGRKTPTSELYP